MRGRRRAAVPETPAGDLPNRLGALASTRYRPSVIALALLAAAAPGLPAPDLLAAARERLAAERPCPVMEATDITVCGRRRAGRFRVPLVVHAPGDPRHEGVPAERARLLHRTTPIDDLSPFLVGGGMAGVSTTVGGDGSVRAATLRQLAP